MSRRKMSLSCHTEERFWEKVDKCGPEVRMEILTLYPELRDTRCIEYTGGKDGCGYGIFWDGEKKESAHRFAYVLHYGEKELTADSKVCVLHKCDNPACVYWLHLFLGTPKTNSEDMVDKGRWNGGAPVGERNGHAKLTEKEVSEIRALYNTGKHAQQKLAEMFSVSQNQISLIVRGKNWQAVNVLRSGRNAAL
jgi:hypothetical protein